MFLDIAFVFICKPIFKILLHILRQMVLNVVKKIYCLPLNKLYIIPELSFPEVKNIQLVSDVIVTALYLESKWTEF